MRTNMGFVALAATLALGTLAGCGSDKPGSDASRPTKGAASVAPPGSLTKSAAPPKLGHYAGVECSGPATTCDAIQNGARARYTAFCQNGVPNEQSASDFTFEGRQYNYVCFTLSAANRLRNFSFAGVRIVRSIYVSSDRFPETCDNGSCIKGTWSSTRSLAGTIRNPNGVRARYRADWIGPRN